MRPLFIPRQPLQRRASTALAEAGRRGRRRVDRRAGRNSWPGRPGIMAQSAKRSSPVMQWTLPRRGRRALLTRLRTGLASVNFSGSGRAVRSASAGTSVDRLESRRWRTHDVGVKGSLVLRSATGVIRETSLTHARRGIDGKPEQASAAKPSSPGPRSERSRWHQNGIIDWRRGGVRSHQRVGTDTVVLAVRHGRPSGTWPMGGRNIGTQKWCRGLILGMSTGSG